MQIVIRLYYLGNNDKGYLHMLITDNICFQQLSSTVGFIVGAKATDSKDWTGYHPAHTLMW